MIDLTRAGLSWKEEDSTPCLCDSFAHAKSFSLIDFIRMRAPMGQSMKKFCRLLMFFSILHMNEAFAGTSCVHLVGSCDYYRCIEEQEISCGNDGYLLGFGGYYCDKFSDKDFPEFKGDFRAELFPANGNQWRDEVRECLQREMEGFLLEGDNLSCSELKDLAFSSHPSCYTGASSFCNLTPENVMAVGLTLEPQELASPAVWKQMQETGEICVKQLEQRIIEADGAWLRFEMHNMKRLWNIVALDPKALFDRLRKREKRP